MDQSGLRGIVKLSTHDEVKKHVQNGLPHSSLPLLVQDFADGVDIDVSVLASEGEIIACTIQKWPESGVLQFVDNKKVLSIAQEIIKNFHFLE